MKSLDQVEPRTIINATNTPGDGNNQFIISQPGSYYFTGNITVNGKTGISIQSDNVTVDLNGFALIGNLTNTATGIIIPGNAGLYKNICVRNGTVRYFGNGGVRGDYARSSLFENLRVSDNSGDVNNGAAGLIVGDGCVARNCAAGTNNCYGIHGQAGSAILDCSAWANAGAGFFLDNGVTVSRCTAKANADGFQAADYCNITDSTALGNNAGGINVALNNSVIDCASSANNNDGILAQQGSTIRGCTTASNGRSGIEVSNACQVTNNTCDNNNHSSSNYGGITATGDGDIIRANSCTNNLSGGYGIKIAGKSVVESNNLDNNTNGLIVSGNANRIEANRASCPSLGQSFIMNGASNLLIRNSAVANEPTNQYPLNGANNHYSQIINLNTNAFPATDAYANFVY